MEELNYRKIKCNQGHWSKVFHQGEAIPARCPECGQPYNRRVNRPVACREDGTIPDIESVNETKAAGLDQSHDHNVAGLDQSHDHNAAESDQSLDYKTVGRNRTFDYNAAEDSQLAGRIRRRSSIMQELNQKDPVGRVHDPTAAHNYGARRRVRASQEEASKRNLAGTGSMDIKQFYLVSAGLKMPVSNEGEQIGREGRFADMCAINRLISRSHAFISVDSRRRQVRLVDMNSLNGTYVDEGEGRRRLSEKEMVYLSSGSRFWLGDQLFIIDDEQD